MLSVTIFGTGPKHIVLYVVIAIIVIAIAFMAMRSREA